jgi:quinol-cytochrome oxidoreductase complex cytochrome b subunit
MSNRQKWPGRLFACRPVRAASGLLNRLYRFGALAVLVFLIQAVSGTYLALFYQPTPAESWASVEFIENSLWPGFFFRSLHRWSAFALTLFLSLHVLGVLFRGAWRKGGLRWSAGILLALLVAALTVTGYLLPWDLRAYWTVQSVRNWFDRLPLFAGALEWLLLADTPNGMAPVGRWFSLHILVLPLLSGLCFAVHFLPQRDSGDPAHKKATLGKEKNEPAPACSPPPGLQAGVAALATVLLLFGLAAFGIQRPDFADPVTTSPWPQPDWLYMLFFQVTRYCQDNWEMVGVFWIPATLLTGMFLLPLLDRGGVPRKWLARLLFPCSLALFLALSIVTAHTCGTTPLWSCASCHKPGFGQAFARAPVLVEDFSTHYDNAWLALHYRYPQYFWMMDADVPGW